MLPVSAPFHCKLMQPAADVMAQALAEVAIKAPAVVVVANVTATPVKEPQEILARLVEQVTATVRWRESVTYMAAHGAKTFFEIGPGKVLGGLIKRIVDGSENLAIGTPQDIETFQRTRAQAPDFSAS
jgi:[acyl-carrier-protein] S-malonyltransferase